ncbi:MAG: fatty acid cis/trans isomerase [Oleibacter sp.]|nr:fatty acid cis/trans isomerase [Thalassolituus sp.]
MKFRSFRPIQIFWMILILAGCATAGMTALESEQLFGKTEIIDHRLASDNYEAEYYRNAVQPILDQRCVVCHACYDAPCQLKTTSPEGLMRGGNKTPVYKGTRLDPVDPTRLNIDAQTTEEWRNKEFHPVLNERQQSPQNNLANSLLYKMLELKQQHPLPATEILDDEFDLSLNRDNVCPTREEFSDFAEDHPKWGMPYALPGLSEKEHNILVGWLKRGAPMSEPTPLPSAIREQINVWENYFNDASLKQQLISRYIYEHLFLANIYFSPEPIFENGPSKDIPIAYFKLVRSYTPPGEPIDVVATRRPYDMPERFTEDSASNNSTGNATRNHKPKQRIYYRLMRNNETNVAKTHMPYRFNEERLQWMKKLFNEPDYQVTEFPSYAPEVAANPFEAFYQLPVGSRYRFMLKEAEFTIRGYIKGPVCRGQVALNVIDDHFFAVFVDPKEMDTPQFAEFLRDQSDNLRLPGEAQSNPGILTNWLKYSSLHSNYLKAKNEAMLARFPEGEHLTMDLIWDGDGHNPNSALTIFRHFDSSTVVRGMVGQPTKTAWLVGYPLLERLHYLLVAEFDVFGNVSHQLMTRLYMDFLRMEGEHNFLTLLPHDERVKLANYWYRDANEEVNEYLLNYEETVLSDPAIDYHTNNPKLELYGKIRALLLPALDSKYSLEQNVGPELLAKLSKINLINGRAATLMPEISYVMLDDITGGKKVFTITRASGHSNLTGLLYEEENRLPSEDYLTIVPGILGSYPNAIYRLSNIRLDDFISAVTQLNSEKDYKDFAYRFAIRRTDPNFWQHSDDLHAWFKRNDSMYAGILDLNRLENR